MSDIFSGSVPLTKRELRKVFSKVRKSGSRSDAADISYYLGNYALYLGKFHGESSSTPSSPSPPSGEPPNSETDDDESDEGDGETSSGSGESDTLSSAG